MRDQGLLTRDGALLHLAIWIDLSGHYPPECGKRIERRHHATIRTETPDDATLLNHFHGRRVSTDSGRFYGMIVNGNGEIEFLCSCKVRW